MENLELKKIALEFCEKNNACANERKKIENNEDVYNVFLQNISWCFEKNKKETVDFLNN